jgi:hypothetical protein
MDTRKVETGALSDDTLDTVSGGLDMNPATNPGHFAGIKKLPPAPASSLGDNSSRDILAEGLIGLGAGVVILGSILSL